MSQETFARYRVFCTASEAEKLPPGISVEEAYPAFRIIRADDNTVAQIRKQFPVERLRTPKAAPQIPAVAGLAAVVADAKEIWPRVFAVQFRAPVRQAWLTAVAKTGCEVREAIGSFTILVNCARARRLTKLENLPMVERVTPYVPGFQISEDFFDNLGGEPDEAALNEAVERIAHSGKETRPSKHPGLRGLLTATFFTPEDRKRGARVLYKQYIREVAEVGKNGLIINLAVHPEPVQAVRTIALLSGLRRLEEKAMRRHFNDVARATVGEGVITQGADSLGLTGRGEIVAVADSGLDTGDAKTVHADFRGRVRALQSFPVVPMWSPMLENPNGDDGPADMFSGHGTHVCGSVLGNGERARALGLDPIQGTAPEADLVFQAIEQTMRWNQQGMWYWIFRLGQQPPSHGLFGIPDDLQELFQAAYDHGARIHTNSWGGGEGGGYGDQCYEVDNFVWEHKDFLILFAAGNEGEDTDPQQDGIDGMSVTPPGTAKNCLTVGACENHRPGQFSGQTYGSWWPNAFPREPYHSDAMTDSKGDVVAFSSRGPTKTGRRKPDVVAPGTYVLSARSSQLAPSNFSWNAFPPAKWDYMYMGGTSMATPLVAGCAGIVRQYLRQQAGIENPSAAMMKAVLIHAGQYQRYRYARPDSRPWADNEQGWGRVELRTVLHPPPPVSVLFFDQTDGLPENDLRQFEVEITDSSVPLRITLVYSDYPGESLVNNLNLFCFGPGGGYQLGNDFQNTGETDSENNVEGIVLEQPQIGVWQVRVVASNVPTGSQEFALVVSGGGLRAV